MKMYTLASLIVATFLTVGYSSVPLADITGTTSVQATFTSTIEAGTCTAQIQSAGGQAISTLAFGDVFKSDLVAQTRSEAFKIAFPVAAAVVPARILTAILSRRATPLVLKSGRGKLAQVRS